jgi:hypothetical protein
MSALLAENTPGPPPSGLPVFVAQGGADTLVVPTATQAYVAAACRSGARITFRQYATDTHGTIADVAVPDVLGLRPLESGRRCAAVNLRIALP